MGSNKKPTEKRSNLFSCKLSSQQRIKTPEEFKRVYQSRQWGGTEYFTFNVLAHDVVDQTVNQVVNQPVSRLGVTVSKKVAKQAVIRNQIKRQIKEFYRCNNDLFIGIDLVISAKPNCASASSKERVKNLQELWEKIFKWQRWYLANKTE